MSCPHCGCNKTAKSDIDDSICCTNCGAVLDTFIIQDFVPESESYRQNKLEKQSRRKHPASHFVAEFTELATYFKLPKELVYRGITIIKENANKFNKKYSYETALCVVYVVNELVKPNLQIQDYYEYCPVAIDYNHVVKTYKILAEKYIHLHPMTWKKPQELSDIYIKRIYLALRKQIYGDMKERNVFTCQQLIVKTKELLDLGERYCVNSGKRVRPSIIVAALISGLSLLVENKKTTTAVNKRISCIKKFNFEVFRTHCPVSLNTFSFYYTEYINLLYACHKSIPFVADERKHVHYHLTDILWWFGKEESPLTLTDEQYSVHSFERSTQAREEMEKILKEAQTMIDKNNIPKDPKSKFSLVFKLLAYGYPAQDILHWSEGYVRIMAHSVDLRTERSNLDEKDLDEDGIQVDYYEK